MDKEQKKDKIELGKHVDLAYAISCVNGVDSEGNIDESQVFRFTEKTPDSFVFGLDPGMIVGFSRNILGLSEGDTFDFILEPEDAFGESDPELKTTLDRSVFEVNGQFDSERVFEGACIPMQTAEGARLDGFVTKVTDTDVTVDFNHQLAGERVHYVGKVLGVRDATPEEINPPHHHGCSCGCDHDHGGHHHHHHDHGCDCDGCDGCH